MVRLLSVFVRWDGIADEGNPIPEMNHCDNDSNKNLDVVKYGLVLNLFGYWLLGS